MAFPRRKVKFGGSTFTIRAGAFRAKAKKAGMSTSAFYRTVLANPGKYSTRTVRQAALAKGFAKARSK